MNCFISVFVFFKVEAIFNSDSKDYSVISLFYQTLSCNLWDILLTLIKYDDGVSCF